MKTLALLLLLISCSHQAAKYHDVHADDDLQTQLNELKKGQ